MQKFSNLLLVVLVFIFAHCKKDGGSSSSNGNASLGSGNFTVAGKTYTGNCVSTPTTAGGQGVDVGIVTGNGDVISIVNLSKASTGSQTLNDGWKQPPGTTYAVVSATGLNLLLGSKAGAGTITKTGTASFTMSCTMYDILNNNKEYSIIANGTYR